MELSPKLQDNNLQIGIHILKVKIYLFIVCKNIFLSWKLKRTSSITFPSTFNQKIMCQLLWHSQYVTKLLGIVQPNIRKFFGKSLGHNYNYLNDKYYWWTGFNVCQCSACMEKENVYITILYYKRLSVCMSVTSCNQKIPVQWLL